MNKVIVIVGPTAIGKTKISIELAKRFKLDIISGDSVAVYKKLDIGSAKPTIEEMDGVKHHLIDIVDPSDSYDVAQFQTDARRIIDNNGNIIICGGTGLYIQSLLYDYEFSAKKRDDSFEKSFKDKSNEELFSYLLKLDPSIDTNKIHPNNRKRVLRAIEVFLNTSKSIHSINSKLYTKYDSYVIYLNVEPRELLYDRINQRVDNMISDGLEEEVRNLYIDGIYPNAIGYKEFLPYYQGYISKETAIDDIKRNTRHLAKRQITWFKNKLDAHIYNVNLDNIDETIDIIYNDCLKFMGE